MMVTVASRRQVRGGDELADLQPLYREHYSALVRLATYVTRDRAAGEELVQDAFIKVHLAQRRGATIDDPAAYLHRAVLNGARSSVRTRLRRAEIERRDLAAAADSGEPDRPGDDAVAGERRAAVLDAVLALPHRQRDCVLLRYFLDRTEHETAATLGVSVGTVKTSCHRALRSLAGHLEALR